MVEQLSSGMIRIIAISNPPEDKTDISREDQLALALQRLEEDAEYNMEKKEHMIMRDGEFATTMQQQEEDEAHELMEKEQRAMAATSTGRALLLVQRVLFLHHFIQYSIPQNLGVASKATTLVMYTMFFLRIV